MWRGIWNRLRSLPRDEEGQALAFFAVTILFLAASIAYIFATGYAVSSKIELQNAADGAAYSGATVAANNLSAINWLNDAMAYLYARLAANTISFIQYGVHYDFVMLGEQAGIKPIRDGTEPWKLGFIGDGYDKPGQITPGNIKKGFEEALQRQKDWLRRGEEWIKTLSESAQRIASATGPMVAEVVFRVAQGSTPYGVDVSIFPDIGGEQLPLEFDPEKPNSFMEYGWWPEWTTLQGNPYSTDDTYRRNPEREGNPAFDMLRVRAAWAKRSGSQSDSDPHLVLETNPYNRFARRALLYAEKFGIGLDLADKGEKVYRWFNPYMGRPIDHFTYHKIRQCWHCLGRNNHGGLETELWTRWIFWGGPLASLSQTSSGHWHRGTHDHGCNINCLCNLGSGHKICWFYVTKWGVRYLYNKHDSRFGCTGLHYIFHPRFAWPWHVTDPNDPKPDHCPGIGGPGHRSEPKYFEPWGAFNVFRNPSYNNYEPETARFWNGDRGRGDKYYLGHRYGTDDGSGAEWQNAFEKWALDHRLSQTEGSYAVPISPQGWKESLNAALRKLSSMKMPSQYHHWISYCPLCFHPCSIAGCKRFHGPFFPFQNPDDFDKFGLHSEIMAFGNTYVEADIESFLRHLPQSRLGRGNGITSYEQARKLTYIDLTRIQPQPGRAPTVVMRVGFTEPSIDLRNPGTDRSVFGLAVALFRPFPGKKGDREAPFFEFLGRPPGGGMMAVSAARVGPWIPGDATGAWNEDPTLRTGHPGKEYLITGINEKETSASCGWRYPITGEGNSLWAWLNGDLASLSTMGGSGSGDPGVATQRVRSLLPFHTRWGARLVRVSFAAPRGPGYPVDPGLVWSGLKNGHWRMTPDLQGTPNRQPVEFLDALGDQGLLGREGLPYWEHCHFHLE